MPKSYNPFKMWGSWIGLLVGLFAIFSPFFDIDANPVFWISEYFRFGLGTFAILEILTPLAGFFIGWGIGSMFDLLIKKLKN